MCTDTEVTGCRSVAEALRAAEAAMDFLNSPAAADLPGDACGDALIALGRIQSKHAAAHAGFLRRFDAADAHDADGYGSPSAWLAARGQLAKKDARAAVREMRQHAERPLLAAALKAGEITKSWANQLADWTRKLPAEMRAETDRILLDAAAAGASLDDLATIAACAIEKWRQQQPDPDDPDDGFEDRALSLGVTFGGAAVLHGSLTPECAAAVRAVLDALGKKSGPEDDRTEPKRFHDALQLAWVLLLGLGWMSCQGVGRPVPVRRGAEVILQCMGSVDEQGSLGGRYQRPYAVPERLDLLRGPSSGTVRLPVHLDWSGSAVYDLDAPGRVVDLYRAVLIEAAGPQDLYAYLDERLLRRLWALLWLPAQLRRVWEQRFPVLAEISRVTATA